MTIRLKLGTLRKKYYIFSFSFWLLFAVSILLIQKNEIFSIISILAFIGFFVSVIRLCLFIRCPRCKNNLGYVICWPQTWSIAKISPKIKLCPFCGVDLDSEIAA